MLQGIGRSKLLDKTIISNTEAAFDVQYSNNIPLTIEVRDAENVAELRRIPLGDMVQVMCIKRRLPILVRVNNQSVIKHVTVIYATENTLFSHGPHTAFTLTKSTYDLMLELLNKRVDETIEHYQLNKIASTKLRYYRQRKLLATFDTSGKIEAGTQPTNTNKFKGHMSEFRPDSPICMIDGRNDCERCDMFINHTCDNLQT